MIHFQEKATDIQYLQFCIVCQGYKAPRSHHCRKCKRFNIITNNEATLINIDVI